MEQLSHVGVRVETVRQLNAGQELVVDRGMHRLGDELLVARRWDGRGVAQPTQVADQRV
ncbi:hypothetical protein SDC9_123146 [bioreactor metagenome]|uniref:Uncharacterized protein n=1 Tax=bioreactor metagenome TaxID=1076179 RepID=A0A645CGR9_9ZZZZ